jgi:hypothetical protein
VKNDVIKSSSVSMSALDLEIPAASKLKIILTTLLSEGIFTVVL